jgi:hypothetical protein
MPSGVILMRLPAGFNMPDEIGTTRSCFDSNISLPSSRTLIELVLATISTKLAPSSSPTHSLDVSGVMFVPKSWDAQAINSGGDDHAACRPRNLQACRDGYRTFYIRAPKFYYQVALAKADGSYTKLMKKLLKTHLLLIDDFGRQQVRPRDLLNRWIVPLENRVDYLTLHNGRKVEVPFDVLIVFSTNLPPRDLVDEAFLRRLRHKIEIGDPSYEDYREIFKPELSEEDVERQARGRAAARRALAAGP